MAVGIRQIATYVPDNYMYLSEMTHSVGLSENELYNRLKLLSKPVLPKNENIVEMGIRACKTLLSSADIDPDSIGSIIYCSGSLHDLNVWAPAAHVQNQINAKNAFTFELNNGCNVGNTGLIIGQHLLGQPSSMNRVLIVIADALSRIINHANSKHLNMFHFSDSATAVLLENSEQASRFLSFDTITDGSYANYAYIPPGGKYLQVNADEPMMQELAKKYQQNYLTVIHSALRKSGLTIDDIKMVFMNQVSYQTLTKLEANLGGDKKLIHQTYAHYGHAGGSDVFLGFNEKYQDGSLVKGDKVVLATSGIGFSWSAVVIEV